MIIVTVVAVCAVLVALIGPILFVVVRRPDFSQADVAAIEMQIRGVGRGHVPLIGAYSRYGWDHLGPLWFLFAAVPYRVFGSDSAALRLTTVLFNAFVIVVLAAVVARRGLAAVLAVLGAVVLLVWGIQAHQLSVAWNVSVALLPFMLTIVACWATWCRDRYAYLVAVLSYSFVLQAHAGYGVALTPLIAITTGLLVVDVVKGHQRDPAPPPRRELALGLGALAISVVLPAVDVIVNWPGNISRMVSWSLRNDEPTMGLSGAWSAIAHATSLTFLAEPTPPHVFSMAVFGTPVVLPFVLVGLLTISAYVSTRFGFTAERRLCECLGVVWASGFLALTTVTTPVGDWLINWLSPLGWLSWMTVLLIVWRVFQRVAARSDMLRPARTLGATTVVLVAVIGSVAYTRDQLRTQYGDVFLATALERFTAEFDIQADSASWPEPISISADPRDLGGVALMLGMINEFDRRSIDVCGPAEFGYVVRERWTCDDLSDPTLLIRSERQVLDPPPGGVLVDVHDQLTPTERAEVDRLTAGLAAILSANGMDDDVQWLFTDLADQVLAGDPPDQLVEVANLVSRLDDLRSKGNQRIALYSVHP